MLHSHKYQHCIKNTIKLRKMILSEIMLNSRNSLIFYRTNKMCRSHLRKFYNYQTFYRCYKGESKNNALSDTFCNVSN